MPRRDPDLPPRLSDDRLRFEHRILELFAAGHTRMGIAAQLGTTYEKVCRVLLESYREQTKDREVLRSQVYYQLLHLERKATARLEENWNASDAKVLIASIDSKKRLFGLDAAIKVETKTVDEFSDSELMEEVRRLGVKVLGVEKALPELPPAAPTDVIDTEVRVIEKAPEGTQT